jgi:hypothetical protein
MNVKALNMDDNWGLMGPQSNANESNGSTRTTSDQQPAPYTAEGAKKTDLRGVRLPADPIFTNMKSKMIRIPPGYNGPRTRGVYKLW